MTAPGIGTDRIAVTTAVDAVRTAVGAATSDAAQQGLPGALDGE
jgi:hypothetical protein